MTGGKPMLVLALEYVHRRQATGICNPDTARQDRTVLTGFARTYGDRPVNRLSAGDVERWLSERLPRCAASTRRHEWSVVVGFIRWLVERNHVRRDPTVGMRAPKVPRSVPRALDRAQAVSLYAGCADSRDRVIITLGLQLALRRSSIASLEVGDVDLVDHSIEIRGKGGHRDRLPLTAEAEGVIADYLRERGLRGGPLLRGDRNPNQGVTPSWVGLRWSEIAYRAGVKQRAYDGVASHSARHTAAKDVFEQTKDALAVQELLRHASLATTDIYLRRLASVERLRPSIEGRRYTPSGIATSKERP